MKIEGEDLNIEKEVDGQTDDVIIGSIFRLRKMGTLQAREKKGHVKSRLQFKASRRNVSNLFS